MRARVAVVEDNPADIFLIKEALLLNHIEGDVVVLEDGEAGFEYIESVEAGYSPIPDIFILDLSLPRRNGPELIERIHASRVFAGVKILIASSSHNAKDRVEAMAHGADDYFIKPSNYDDYIKIGDVVAELLNGHRSATPMLR